MKQKTVDKKTLSANEMSAVGSRDGSDVEVRFVFMDGTERIINNVDYYLLRDAYVVMLVNGVREYVPFANVRAFEIAPTRRGFS